MIRCGATYALYSWRMCGLSRSTMPSLGSFIREYTTCVQWLSFIGFYQKKIIKDFTQSAIQHSITGFLAHGKPAVACLEGRPEDIQDFLRYVRKTVFATVPRSARKMTLGLREVESTNRKLRFNSFEAKAFHSQGAHHRPDMLDRRQLEIFLLDHGVPEEICAEVLGATPMD